MATPSTATTVSTSNSADTNSDYVNLLKTNPGMTLAQYNQYNENKTKYYKGSIAVCVTYSVFSLLLLLLAFFSERAKEIIGDTIMPFTITFVIGTVIIVTILAIQISSYKPHFTTDYIYDRDVCPNYWKLEKTPPEELSQFNKDIQPMMKYRCKPDTSIYPLNTYFNGTNALKKYTANVEDTRNNNIYGHNIFKSNSTNTTTPENYRYGVVLNAKDNDKINNPGLYQLVNGVQNGTTNINYLNQMYGNTNITDSTGSINKAVPGNTSVNAGSNNTMMCDVVYPNFIAAKDYKDFPNSPNLYRCQWASACGIPWSTACPTNNNINNSNDNNKTQQIKSNLSNVISTLRNAINDEKSQITNLKNSGIGSSDPRIIQLQTMINSQEATITNLQTQSIEVQ